MKFEFESCCGTLTIFLLLLSNTTSHSIDYNNVEYSARLKKSDPFIDDFVPTEYTSGLISKYDNNVLINVKDLGYKKYVKDDKGMKHPSIVSRTIPLPVKEVFKANPAYARHKRHTKEGKVRRRSRLNNYIYLHENYEQSNDHVELELDLTQDSSLSQSGNVHQINDGIKLNAKNGLPINSETKSNSVTVSPLEDQITSRQPRHTTQSKNPNVSEIKESFQRPMVPSKPSKDVSRHIQSPNQIYSSEVLNSITNNEGNISKKVERWSLHGSTGVSNDTKASEQPEDMTNANSDAQHEDYEDLTIDLMARDVRHFDNYSNISSLSKSPATSTVSTKFVVNETESISPPHSIQGLNTTEEQQSIDNEEKYDLKEIRKRVQEYFIVVKTLSNPRVMELFQKLNKTLENPDSETKQTVFTLFLALVQELQHQHSPSKANKPNEESSVDNILGSRDTNSSIGKVTAKITKPPRPLKDPKCYNLEAYTIYPNDSSRDVRKKQASKMSCYMNPNADPCDQFYEYACGRWELHHPIPKDRVGYDIFEILREGMDQKLVSMLKEKIVFPSTIENTEFGSMVNSINYRTSSRKELNGVRSKNLLSSLSSEKVLKLQSDNNATIAIKILYDSCMKEEIIEARKEAPLQKLLQDEFGGWPVLESMAESGYKWNESSFDWQDTIVRLRQYNNDILVALWVGPDIQDSDEHIVQFDQSQLMLASAEYYQLGLSHPIMQTYYNILVSVAKMMGADDKIAKKDMKDLLEFEIELAKIMIPPEDRRNYSAIYNKITLDELQQMVGPGFNFTSYLDALLPRKLRADEKVVMYALPYFKSLTKLLEQTDKRIVANYVLWRFIRHRIINLDRRYPKVMQELYRKLYGIEEKPPRWKFCTNYVRGNLGNALGSLYVKRYFDEHSKEDMELLTSEVQAVFQNFISTKGGWISDATKAIANEKIENIARSIGYPDSILDDELLEEEVTELKYQNDQFFENVLMNLRRSWKKEMNLLDKSVNRTHWTATPTDVNAYYSRNRNQIMFPAAILQPPFYHKFFPRSLNFGGIGVVIGHEITHGFDDKGRQFDQKGNIDPWWDEESLQKFQSKAQCIIDQYGNYKVDEVDVYLNGINTQGENIADNGGIKQAFYAYKNWLNTVESERESDTREENDIVDTTSSSASLPIKKKPETLKSLNNEMYPDESLPGLENLSGEQLFFLNFAQVWCGSTRPEAMRSKLKTAVHAPGKYRVLGTLSNSEEFSKAFRCPKRSTMNPENKCSLW